MTELAVTIIFSALYSLSVVGSLIYFIQGDYNGKAIYLIASFTPLWNTYFAIKLVVSFDFRPFLKSLKYHFTRDMDHNSKNSDVN